MSDSIQEFLNVQLIQNCQLATVTDLADKFDLDAGAAKRALLEYYSATKNKEVQRLIVCVYGTGTIRVVYDDADVHRDGLTDAFLYGLSPSSNLSLSTTVRSNPTLKNPYTLVAVPDDEGAPEPPQRSRTEAVEDGPRPNVRGNQTYPAAAKPSPPKVGTPQAKAGKFETGLRSTAIIARMREDREKKERERQEELKKRRQKSTIVTEEKKLQMAKLAQLFDGDSDSGDEEKGGPDLAAVLASQPSVSAPDVAAPSAAPDQSLDLEALLDTTADESLLSIHPDQGSPTRDSQAPESTAALHESQPQSTTEDEDGYLVTTKTQHSASPAPSSSGAKRPAQRAGGPPPKSAKTAAPSKKVQSSLMNFFKKK
ncbi:AaceriAEL075Wp [[Ashbya] aceris (nom. inval.)]|nr:AaceriAEL075Wp [[Ashbya] aceris (nom. inval.)]